MLKLMRFFCFTNLMGEIKDSFVKTLDHSKVGIRQKILDLNNILRVKDFELWEDLENKQLSPEFYSFRWLTLLLSQEFELPDVLRLWDSLLSDQFRFEYLLYVCVALLVDIREQLLLGDFAESLKILQTYPPTDMIHILDLANEIADPGYALIPSPLEDPTSVWASKWGIVSSGNGSGNESGNENENGTAVETTSTAPAQDSDRVLAGNHSEYASPSTKKKDGSFFTLFG